MDSRGNSIGERESGADSNKASLNLLDSAADADSRGIQNLSLYSDVQKATSKYMDDHVPASALEESANEGNGLQLSSTINDSLNSRHSKPVLEIGNGLTQTCHTSYNKDVRFGDEKKTISSACLTMSLGLHHSKGAEADCSSLSLSNLPSMFGSQLEPYSEAERNNLKFSGMNAIRTKPRQLLPKQPQMPQPSCFEASRTSQGPSLSRPDTPKEPAPAPIRVARPPVEGRGRNQLLPRYWPRITDQELQQITAGDSNSTITPLFEKMLSASDAGRIGRLVLPKACAEAYFPPISQPEGLPLKIQDVSGKDWVFQFRFWPNNNSRMYVLEGVTPCIQSMQLQAGDTVTFSRLDPEGKLVMGYRRAPSSLSSQETQPSVAGPSTAGPSIMMAGNSNMDIFPTIASLTDLMSQSAKSTEMPINGMQGHLHLSDTGYGWYKSDKGVYKGKEGSFFQSMLASDRKKSRPVGSKVKRSFTDMDEAAEFRISWEEAQDLLRSPPNVIPSIITVEGFEFEEYEEPPVLGKRSIFTVKECGPGEDQWAQCDDCGSWRKVPSDVFLPTRWVCNDNVWDANRNFCNAPQEVDSEEIELLMQNLKEISKQETTEQSKGNEPSLSGLVALANAATAGENNVASSSSPAAATTKHPRHRPGCTCIVCIQPPSGKGPKHKPTCNCNVCMTVKRRFKTLMMRRKKRQSEREAEHAARKKRPWIKEDGGEANGSGKWSSESFSFSDSVTRQGNLVVGFPNALPRTPSLPNMTNGNRFFPNLTLPAPYLPRGRNFVDDPKAHIDLNTQPERDEEANRMAFRVSMVRLLQNATHPLESYLKEQGLMSLVAPPHMAHSSINFGRTKVDREPDIHWSFSQTSAMPSTDRSQDEPCITLGMSRFETAAD
ncbi:hypothetical protein L7F22_054428 [Adiantum nelumboides]|nr:hypothetical protein [Adiantum nelumboides]